MTKQEKIKTLLTRLIDHYHLKEVTFWTNSDYEFLSNLLFEKTKNRLSSRTLRRIVNGYLFDKTEMNPSVSTLNVLAQSLGFENWHAYFYQKTEHNNKPNQKDNVKKKFTTLFLTLLSLVVIIPSILFFTLKRTKASFKLPPYLNTYPRTITIDYMITHPGNRTFYIRADVEQGILKNIQAEKLVLEKRKISLSIKEPGMYKVYITENKNEYGSKKIFVFNNCWEYSIYNYNNYLVAFKDVKPENGILKIKPDAYFKTPSDSSKRWFCDLTLFQKFDVSLDSFRMDVRLKNIYFEDIGCNQFKISLFGKQQNIKLYLTDSTCYNQTKIKVGNLRYDEKFEYNKKLHRDFSQWTDITMYSNNDTFSLFFNNELSYQTSFHECLDSLRGIKLWFLEGCELDYIRILNHKQKLEYENNFD